MSKLKVVSVFSGVGGIDFGFHREGFETVFATDIWSCACESFQANFPSAEVQVCDIVKVDFSRIKRRHGSIDVLVGGPPCPPFSKSRFYRKEKERGLNDETGLSTVSNYFRAVSELGPKVFFFENVHGFVYKPHKSALDFVQSESARLGYKIFHQVMNAADFGVPQTRQRFICIGVKKELGDFVFPKQTHSDPTKPVEGTIPWKTCGEVLNQIDYPLPEDSKMVAGSKHSDLLESIPPEIIISFLQQKEC